MPESIRQRQWLLASDMDGTAIPLEESAAGRETVARFRSLVQSRKDLLLAYVTGRHLELAREGIIQHRLPEPDFLICDVGTTLYRRVDDSWIQDNGYQANHLRHWPPGTTERITTLLGEIPTLRRQEEYRQGPFKQSYFFTLGPGLPELLRQVRDLLDRAVIPHTIIHSRDQAGTGLLDILPPSAAKDQALQYLVTAEDISRQRVIYAGDSGNDLAAFLSGFASIVVSNTDRRTRDTVRTDAAARGIGNRIYFAASPATAGLLEGCRHFGLTAS